MIEYKVITQKYNQLLELKLTRNNARKYVQTEGPGGYYSYTWKCSKKEREDTLEYIAHILSDIVQEEVITTFVRKYLRDCTDFTKTDKQQISKMFITNNYLAKEDGVSYLSYYLVYMPLLNMMEEKKSVNLEGWICFRTGKYRMLLQDILEQMIYDFKTQKEYMSFLDVLIASKNLEVSEQEYIHLVPNEYGQIHLLDEDKKEATWQYIHDYCSDMMEEGVAREDLVINILITIAPHYIYIHQKGKFANQQFITTVEKVFFGQIKYCDGCQSCMVGEDKEKY